MSHTIELTYFAGRGLAEVIRLLLSYLDVDYSERNIATKEEWLALKPSLPYGQVPLLTIDGKRLVQRKAIERYISTKHNLYGKNADEAYEIDSINESIADLTTSFPLREILSGDPTADDKSLTFENGSMKWYLGIWEKMLLARNPNLHFVGDGISYADINLFSSLRSLKQLPRFSKALDEYPTLTKFFNHIASQASIAKYLSSPKCYPFPPPAEYLKMIRAILYS